MLAIILQILKIIGIVLLIIFALFIVLVLCVLFVPIRYRIKASAQPIASLPPRDNFGDVFLQNEIKAEVKVFWLLHIVILSFQMYKKGIADIAESTVFDPEALKEHMHLRLRIFGITLMDFLHPKPKKLKKQKKESKKESKRKSKKEPPKASEKESIKEPEMVEAYVSDRKDSLVPVRAENDFSESQKENNLRSNESDCSGKSSLFHRFTEKLRLFLETLKKIFEKVVHIKYTVIEIIEKVKRIKTQIEYYKETLTGKHTKPARDKAFLQLKKIWHNIKPSKHRIALKLGVPDPAQMGEILAVFGICMPFLGNTVSVTPYFDCFVMEGDMEIKGRMTVFVFLRTVWIMLFDKDLKKLWDLLKNPDL